MKENWTSSNNNHAKLATMGHSLSVVVIVVNQSLQKMQRHLLFEFSVVVNMLYTCK